MLWITTYLTLPFLSLGLRGRFRCRCRSSSLRPDRDLFEDIWQVLDPYRVEDGPTIDQAITETCSAFGKYLSKVSWPNVHGGINAEQEAVTVGVCSLVIVYGKKRAMAILTEALRRTEALTVFASFEANP